MPNKSEHELLKLLQSEVIKISEDDDELDLKDNQGSSDNLDDLLKDDKDGGGDKTDKDLDDLPSLSDDNLKDDKGLEGSKDDLVDKEQFETDHSGLVDTIKKLTQSGHTVKIVVTAEGKQTYLIDDKNVTLEELTEIINNNDRGSAERMTTSNNNVLMQKIAEMEKELAKMKAVSEGANSSSFDDEVARLAKDPKHSNIISYIEDLKYRLEENQEKAMAYDAMCSMRSLDEKNSKDIDSLISEFDKCMTAYNEHVGSKESTKERNVEAITEGDIKEFKLDPLEEAAAIDHEIRYAIDHLEESVNKLKEFNAINKVEYVKPAKFDHNTFAFGAHNSFDAISEMVLPIMHSVNLSRANIMAMVDNTVSSKRPAHDITDKMSKLDKLVTEMKDSSYNIKDIASLLENLVNSFDTETISKENLLKAINEASDIANNASDDGYDTNYPKYEYFSKRVMDIMKDAGSSLTDKSDIASNDTEEGLDTKTYAKSRLPFMEPEKYNANITIKSAIANLAESLIDVDGNINLDLCEQAYLYKKVDNPKSLKDFAIPIAIMDHNTNTLVAHPKLVMNAANILKNDTCMRTYEIRDRNHLYKLRDEIEPYLNELNADIPWNKKEVKKPEVKDATDSAAEPITEAASKPEVKKEEPVKDTPKKA